MVPARFDWIIDGDFFYDELGDEEVELAAFMVGIKKQKGCFDYHGNELLPAMFDEINVYARLPYSTLDNPQLVWGEFNGKLYVNINDEFDETRAQKFDENVYFDKIVG